MKGNILTVNENEDGDLFIDLPERLIDMLNWVPGDDLDMIITEDNEIIIQKRCKDEEDDL